MKSLIQSVCLCGAMLCLSAGVFAVTINVPADYSTIQLAIDASMNGDTIIVSPGTYYENIHFNGKNFILTSTNPEDPGIVASTIIDGDGDGSVVTFSGSETPDCLLKGITVTGMDAWWNSSEFGAIEGNCTLATISHCMIVNNESVGLRCCHGTIISCTISNNIQVKNFAHFGWDGPACGGGLFDCDGAITNCIISNNQAIGYSDAYLETFAYGGGLYGCSGPITNCIVTNNCAVANGNVCGSAYGGGLYGCSGPIANCTITSNKTYTAYGRNATHGGGLSGCSGITNCIIWGNSATDPNSNQLDNGSIPSFSCIQGWTGGGIGNINSDPLFANGAGYLKSEYGRWDEPNSVWYYDDTTSPCIDTGDPENITYWDPNGTPNDPNDDYLVELVSWQDELWPHGGRINMGAYGGTPQASMSPSTLGNVADLNHDDAVGILDLDLLSEDWLYAEYLLDTDLNRNGKVDIADFSLFANQWLWTEP